MRAQRRFGMTVLGLAALAPLLGAAGLARADVIISNLPGNDAFGTFINAPAGGNNGGGAQDSKAAGFTLPAGLAYSLTSAELRLEFFDTASVPDLTVRRFWLEATACQIKRYGNMVR